MSRREIKRAIENLESDKVAVTDAHTLLVPESAIPEQNRRSEPDVSTEAVTVLDEETGKPKHVIPLHSKPATNGLPLISERGLRWLWGELSSEQRDRERRLRETYDLSMPPLLETDTT